MGIAQINETIDSCKFCFMCRHACPTFLATRLDSHTPRGYALLLAEIRDGAAKWSEAIIDRFYQCSQCGLCRQDCEYHWPEDELVRHAREEIVRSGLSPARVKELAESFECIPPITTASKHTDVLYFPGWRTRRENPEIVESTCALLGALKLQWAMPEGEAGSGIELYELGYTDKALKAASQLADYIRNAMPAVVLTGCPHTLKAFKELYPKLGLEIPGGVKILHTSQLLESSAAAGGLGLHAERSKARIGYHDPCNLGRNMKIFDEPRKLIERISGAPPIELFHDREKAECCGAGSVMDRTDPHIAERVASKRLESASEEGIELLITACQNCKALLARTAKSKGLSIRIKDIAEYVREHMEAER